MSQEATNSREIVVVGAGIVGVCCALYLLRDVGGDTAIDLEVTFELSDSVQHRFLNGLDDIGLTLQQDESIDAYETTRPAFKPTTR